MYAMDVYSHVFQYCVGNFLFCLSWKVPFPFIWKMSYLSFWLELIGPIDIGPIGANQYQYASPGFLIWDRPGLHACLMEEMWGYRADRDHASHHKKKPGGEWL